MDAHSTAPNFFPRGGTGATDDSFMGSLKQMNTASALGGPSAANTSALTGPVTGNSFQVPDDRSANSFDVVASSAQNGANWRGAPSYSQPSSHWLTAAKASSGFHDLDRGDDGLR